MTEKIKVLHSPPVLKEDKLPKTIANSVDVLYKVRADRLALSNLVKELEATEAQLRERIIAELPKDDATGIAGKLARATVEKKTIFQVEDWGKLHGFIVKEYKKNPGVFAFLQRRVGDAACADFEEQNKGKLPPGVTKMFVPVVRLNKV